ncbi:MAG TPA: amino acid permease [Parachlamydiales bacterium]|nr:MAG: amino acid permease [Chlamydiae bacterium GWA2_50_15]OGN54653.1 MAG: amino acid permease [Chlamydiae bacterium GWF2_49_8]OGN57621.1 MAG: amino acid permease [Chlamydiae bacterium RIFCSPHIGHO2_02_FULL_49_29]OGN62909.1 MAG: amino acid permease [Chlamydiae bacterium RIFCSPHIGHO2_12_FULL_49_32]OGN68008.1 MAG: amino acid permease [Chlamydiae bacterium RIFCSPLOWO2_02_FULL_49_12]OGN71580.1 MAG: amino acid permease [Chlamydiae bacterium RIFCSPLOWO2_12_FULL_49_12]HAZ16211.1 amino acid permease
MAKPKQLGLASLTALVTGSMIGSGIFILPAQLANLGSLSLLSWLFTTAGAFLLALVFSRMGRFLPKTGGPYAYARAGMGNLLGFQTAFSYWLSIWIGNAAMALAAVGYLSVFYPVLSKPYPACFTSIAFIWVLTAINLMGVHTAGIVQLITTILKLIPILLIGALGWFFFRSEHITESLNVTSPHLSGFNLITHGATLTLWAFLGVESATVPAGSVKNPTRTIPLATLFGTVIAAVAYISSSAAIMGMLPIHQLQKSVFPFADAAALLFGSWGKALVAIGAIISCLGSLNGWILLQGQIPMAAADDQLFLKIFSRLNKRGVPALGLIITSFLISLLLLLTISPDLVKQFQVLILLATFTSLVPYLYTPVSEILLLREEKGRLEKGTVCIAVVAMLYALWALVGSGTEILSYGALVLLVSIPLYLLSARKRAA